MIDLIAPRLRFGLYGLELLVLGGLVACSMGLRMLRGDPARTPAEKNRATIYVGIALVFMTFFLMFTYIEGLTFIPYPGRSPTITIQGLLWCMPFAFVISLASVFLSAPIEASRVMRQENRSPAYKTFRGVGLLVALVGAVAVMVHLLGR